jgi:hypothetical protein
MIVVLTGGTTEVVTRPAEVTSISAITINNVTDNKEFNVLFAQTKELGIITLFQGAAYTDLGGTITDSIISNRINELYS